MAIPHAIRPPSTPAASRPQPRGAVLRAAALAALLGLVLLFGVGFAHPHAVHEAAHDVRHGIGFPCH